VGRLARRGVGPRGLVSEGSAQVPPSQVGRRRDHIGCGYGGLILELLSDTSPTNIVWKLYVY
jgi:hypothetical protein